MAAIVGAVLLVALVAVGSCGGSDDTGLNGAQEEQLNGLIADARHAAKSDSAAAARAALEDFSHSVRAFADSGSLSAEEAALLLTAAEQAQVRAEAELSPDATSPEGPASAAAPEPLPAAPAPDEGKVEADGEEEDEDEDPEEDEEEEYEDDEDDD